MIYFPESQSETAFSNMLSQHKSKPNIESFVKSFYAPLDAMTTNAKRLLENRGIETASGKQLDLIGDIVGIARIVPNSSLINFFGYEDQALAVGYGMARYRKATESFTNAYELPDEEYRRLIKAKIILNNSHGTREEIIQSAIILFKANQVTITKIETCKISIVITRLGDSTDGVLTFYERFLPVASGIDYVVSYLEG